LIRFSPVGGAVITMAVAQFALAADLPTQTRLYTRATTATWSGLYVGGSLGGRWSDTFWSTEAIGAPLGPPDPTTTPASFSSSSFRAGGFIGYNWQFTALVIGLEGDAAWGRNRKTLAGIPGTFGPSGLGVDAGVKPLIVRA
jgi:outer membrane immunogenic protein